MCNIYIYIFIYFIFIYLYTWGWHKCPVLEVHVCTPCPGASGSAGFLWWLHRSRSFVLAGLAAMRILKRSIVTLFPPLLWQPGVWWLQCVLVWLDPWRLGAPGVCWSSPLVAICPPPLLYALLAMLYSTQRQGRLTKAGCTARQFFIYYSAIRFNQNHIC